MLDNNAEEDMETVTITFAHLDSNQLDMEELENLFKVSTCGLHLKGTIIIYFTPNVFYRIWSKI